MGKEEKALPPLPSFCNTLWLLCCLWPFDPCVMHCDPCAAEFRFPSERALNRRSLLSDPELVKSYCSLSTNFYRAYKVKACVPHSVWEVAE